ncbi:MAG: hypothetical protein U5Q03_20185 [Bacteroidota bacterium]|nr:hypothetical protein [Bacteroidota bacterium]
MIFIYGEYDPWTASGIEFSGKENMIKIVKAGGTHATRISNLTEEQNKVVIAKIREWLEE